MAEQKYRLEKVIAEGTIDRLLVYPCAKGIGGGGARWATATALLYQKRGIALSVVTVLIPL